MSIFLTFLALWLFAHYTAILVLAQENLTTVTTTTTLVISVYAFAPNASSPTTTIAHIGDTNCLTLAATPTTAMENTQSDLAQYRALDSPAPHITTPSTADPPYPHKAADPEWLLPVSIALLCYDFLAATAFIWCWIMGYFWWWRRARTSTEVRVLRERRGESTVGVLMNENIEWEMRRLGLV